MIHNGLHRVEIRDMVAPICLPTIAQGLGEAIELFDGVRESLVGHSQKGEKVEP